jgi:hypothetical protein
MAVFLASSLYPLKTAYNLQESTLLQSLLLSMLEYYLLSITDIANLFL